jgi:hypothetical protein
MMPVTGNLMETPGIPGQRGNDTRRSHRHASTVP